MITNPQIFLELFLGLGTFFLAIKLGFARLEKKLRK